MAHGFGVTMHTTTQQNSLVEGRKEGRKAKKTKTKRQKTKTKGRKLCQQPVLTERWCYKSG